MRFILITVFCLANAFLTCVASALTFDNSQNLVETTQIYRDTVIITFRESVLRNVELGNNVSIVNKDTKEEIPGEIIDRGSYAFKNVEGKGMWQVKTVYDGVFPDDEEKGK